MKIKNLFVLTTIIALLFGIGFLLVPATVLSLYGIGEDANVELMARFFGSALLAIGLVCWFARDVTNAVALRAILLAFLISDSVGLIVTFQGIFSGVLNSFAWSVALIYLILVLGFAYFLFKKPADS